jgi:ubiquitin C-terminal hydrolase
MTPNTFRCLSTSPTTIPAVLQFFYFGGGGAKYTMTKKEMTGHTTTSGYDAPTPIISNRKASAPRFSSLDGPILRVEYYKEPVVASHAVLLSSSSDHGAVAGVVVQLGLQASQFLYKRTLAKIVAAVMTTTIPSLRSGRRRTANTSHNRNSFGGFLDALHPEPPVQGIANYGQTCFANAILQALAASTSMYEYTKQMRPFSATANELYLVLHQLRSNSTAAAAGAGLTTTTTTTIIVDPRPLLRQFYTSTHEQNDAQEFLQRMIDSIVDQVDWSAYANFRERSKTRSTTTTTTTANRRRRRQPLSPPTAIGSIAVVEHGGGDGVLVGASEDEWWSSSDEDDEQRSWSSMSSCQVAVQLKSSRLRKAVVVVDDDDDDDKLCHGTKLNAELVQDHNATVPLLPAIAENRLDAKANGMPHGGANMVVNNNRGGLGKNGSAATQPMGNSNGREVMFSESKEEMNPGDDDDDHDDHEDELHVNFSKDTVISAESVWIHSYSYSMGEEKKDDTAISPLPTGLDMLKQSAFCIDTKRATLKKKKQETLPEMVVEYSALSPSPLHGWMGTLLTCDACQSKDRPIRNALCCTIPVLPTHPHLVDCVRAVLTSERVEHVQCDYCPRDPALLMERQDWIKAIQHASGDTSATQAELERVEEALTVPIYADATKASIFMRLPSVLSLHIQRRRPDGRKNTQHVSFDELFVISGARYRLIAVIEHLGGPNAGHYVCYRPQWWRISDRSVRQVDWNQVRSSQAYMLFYERIDTTNSITTADGDGGSN